MGVSPICRINRNPLRPHRSPDRTQMTRHCRDPYHGVVRNCSSIRRNQLQCSEHSHLCPQNRGGAREIPARTGVRRWPGMIGRPRSSLPFGRGSTTEGFRQKIAIYPPAGSDIGMQRLHLRLDGPAAPRSSWRTRREVSLACRLPLAIVGMHVAWPPYDRVFVADQSLLDLGLESAEKLRRVPIDSDPLRSGWGSDKT